MAACSDTTKEASETSDNEILDNSQEENEISSNKDLENEQENIREETEDIRINDDQEESSSANINDGETTNNDIEHNKEAYLEKLNDMFEADRYAESAETMVEMEEQEEKRFKKWDEELNKIYGMLEESLSKDEMEQLREEQREWVKERDDSAKEASLKYKGGSTETLEYIATQASLTRERCFQLVAHYMD